LETPNINSKVYGLGRLLSLLCGGRPQALFSRLFPPQHIQYFTLEALRSLADQSGFDIVSTGTRLLPASDIAAGWATRVALTVLQTIDELTGSRILIWAVLRRAGTDPV
jgi:hypothetical protein